MGNIAVGIGTSGVQRSADEVHAMSLANLNREYAAITTAENLLSMAVNSYVNPPPAFAARFTRAARLISSGSHTTAGPLSSPS